jgi:CheY-like chemotaxis protein
MTTPRVLVIDNSPVLHDIVDKTLQDLGYLGIHVRDGISGISKAEEIIPDLILLDYILSDMNGYQVSRELEEMEVTKSIPIVLMSSRNDKIGQKLVNTMGIVDYITKPFSSEALSTVLQHALKKHSKNSSNKKEAILDVGKRLPDIKEKPIDFSGHEYEPAIRGDISVIPAPEIFQLIKFQSHSGILHLVRGRAHLEVFIKNGKIVFSRARNIDEEFLLGRFIIEIDAISPGDLELFLQSRRKGKQLFGEQLVKLGHVTDEQLEEALARQTESLLYEVLRWGDGRFAFFATGDFPYEIRKANLDLSIDHILMEGFRRVDVWGMVEKEISNFDLVFALLHDPSEVKGGIELNNEEKLILSLVNGYNNVRDIIRASRKSSFDVCNILYRLLSSRIIHKSIPLEDSGS